MCNINDAWEFVKQKKNDYLAFVSFAGESLIPNSFFHRYVSWWINFQFVGKCSNKFSIIPNDPVPKIVA